MTTKGCDICGGMLLKFDTDCVVRGPKSYKGKPEVTHERGILECVECSEIYIRDGDQVFREDETRDCVELMLLA